MARDIKLSTLLDDWFCNGWRVETGFDGMYRGDSVAWDLRISKIKSPKGWPITACILVNDSPPQISYVMWQDGITTWKTVMAHDTTMMDQIEAYMQAVTS